MPDMRNMPDFLDLQKQKRFFLIYVLFMMIFSSGFCQENKIKISKIKVFLDDVELTEQTELSEEQHTKEIKLSTILSYTKLRKDKFFTQKALVKELTRTKLRLMDSGLFYTAEVESLPSRKNPGTVVV